ncbi:MAG: hypothetical protein WDW36_005204 [Sanguina aurantia]
MVDKAHITYIGILAAGYYMYNTHLFVYLPNPWVPVYHMCVARFDHHCSWINNDVGLLNLRAFLTFLATNCLMCVYGAVLAAAILGGELQARGFYDMKLINYQTGQVIPAYLNPGRVTEYLLVYFPVAAAMALFMVLTCFLMGFFLSYQLYLLSQGKTQYESFRWLDVHLTMIKLERARLKRPVVLSFHACGGNVGDTIQVPLPGWVLQCGESDPDLFFTDRPRGSAGLGQRNREYLSVWADDAAGVICGRSPMQCYEDFMELGSFVEDIVVGSGPCGELRFPAYVEANGWKFPGVGEFQCYDRRALASLAQTRAEAMGLELHVGDDADAAGVDSFGVLLQYPNTFGQFSFDNVSDYKALADATHARGGLVAVASDLLALTLIASPGEWGADIVVGNSQRFGVPFGNGGPHAAFMACRDAYKRSMPGRLIGVSIDAEGKPAYRLTLQTREQHIRREKATSNICTAQVLLAVMASMYAVYHGPDGLTRIASRVHRLSAILASALDGAGITVGPDFFDTLHVLDIDADAIHARAASARLNLRRIDSRSLGISLDETTTRDDVIALAKLFGAGVAIDDIDALDAETGDALPAGLRRTSTFLTHPVFNTHHSEHELLRYMRSLADKDLAMDRTMIPLGSCTMKLNATAEMIPVTWPEFGNIHPLALASQTQGYTQLIESLEAMLVECTGYDAVSLQPNSGAQGEYAGLLAIRAYHRSRHEGGKFMFALITNFRHLAAPADSTGGRGAEGYSMKS